MVRILFALVLAAASPDPGAAGVDGPDVPASDDVFAPELGRRDPRLRPPPVALSLDLHRAPERQRIGRLYLRPIELSRAETALKGMHLAATSAAFLGALSVSYDMWSERETWWLVGGAAALGALYGGTLGFEHGSLRIDARLTEE